MLLWLALACQTVAQPTDPDQGRQFNELLPAQRLGARVRAVNQAVGVSPYVVVVQDERSFVEAIARWTPALRYPVLIDDGSPAGREAIARFVRAYEPQGVFRWASQDAQRPWNGRERREAVEAAVLRVWGVVAAPGQQPMPAAIEQWRALQAPPPGVVVVGEGDAPWPAALALAAARMQPIVWLSAPGGINQTIDEAQADEFCRTLEGALDALDLRWSGLGDEIDSVTLCMNAPARLETLQRGTIAFTARVGRHGSADRSAPRWAWCGHIFGSPARTAVDAMASIFLPTPSAWLFDSYPSDPPWSNYALSAAADIYRQMQLDVTINPTRQQGLTHFMQQASTPLDAGFIAVNTKGRLAEFHLEPGTATGRDVPILSRPAAVYFIHSFSAQRPGVNTSVAGAWLGRGAFAYMGSVDEPGLQSFVPQVTYAARLGSLFPFGAAGREDGLLENRKLAVFGDPLWMLERRPRARVDGDVPFFERTSFEELAKRAIEAGDLGEAGWALRMAGRNSTLVDLAMATLRDEPGKVTADLAEASLHALFEAGERRGVAAMFARMPLERQSDIAVEDMVWHALRPLLRDRETASTMARLLSPHIRPQTLVDDARELSRALSIGGEMDEARTLLRAAMGRARTDQEREDLDAALSALR